MRLFLLVIILFLVSQTTFSQKKNYLDSISYTIENLPKKEQVTVITSIPFDKVKNNLKDYEKLINKAIVLSEETNDTLLLSDSYAAKTFVVNNEEQLSLSLKAIRLYEQIDKLKKAAKLYTTLGWQLKWRDFEKAFAYYQKGLNTLERQDDKSDIDAVYDNYGVLLGMKKEWDSALFYHEKSLKIKKSLNDSVGIPFGYSHLANVYLKQNKYSTALKYLDSSLVIRKSRNDVYGIADSYLYYGDLYFTKGDFKLAEKYFENGYNISLKNHFFPLKKYASEYLYKSNDSLGEYKKALRYNAIFNGLKDSVLNVQTNNKVSELEVKFRTENKEKEILLQRADLAEKELRISQKNTQIIGLTILALVLTLLGYLLFNQQKLKNKQLQKESELKQAIIKIETQNGLQDQRLRISRDLHDNIGAQLTFIISSLDNLKYGFQLPDKLNAKLQTISAFTSSTIYELRDTIWAMNKSEITLDDLQARISNFIKKADNASEKIKFEFRTDKINSELQFTSVEGMNIYRIIQEAINNALKYAKPSRVMVEIEELDSNIFIQIVDDGIGFDSNTTELGNGLYNMRKRASEINAEFNLSSETNKGTVISINKPIYT